MTKTAFSSEAEMVQAWLEQFRCEHSRLAEKWAVYPETAGWDLLLVHRDGYQLGIEAKLRLNAKVIDQALSGQHFRREPPPAQPHQPIPRRGASGNSRRRHHGETSKAG